jgi:cyclopropane-fatty-acyl-phospholipid synthase
MTNAKELVQKFLTSADIIINGSRPQDIQVHDERFYSFVLSGGSLALGESYMNGWWDCQQLDEFFYRILNIHLDKRIIGLRSLIVPFLKAKLLNRQRSHSGYIGAWHYDLGNDLYKAILDKNMQYSCAYWRNAHSLDEAQEHKMDLICRKLKLKRGERLLDIGCGWGGLLKYAAKKYGIIGVGITVSKEQADFARENCRDFSVDIRLVDYRSLDEQFDKIVSVGMIEHVGFKNYDDYLMVVHRCLKDGGIFLLHTIGSNRTTKGPGDPWIDKYIFPDGKLPSAKQLISASEKFFVMEDWHNFGSYYDKTLLGWRKNFIKAWPKLKKHYDERFYRMWTYYLSCCAGGFRCRGIQLWQVVFTKSPSSGVYEREK